MSPLSESDEWATPPALFEAWHRRYGFTLDVAAAAWNAKVCRYFDRGTDGLAQSWRGERVWCNPPYSRGSLDTWMAKARQEARGGALVVCLVPAYTAEGWFQRHVLAPAGALREAAAGPGWVRWDWEALAVELHLLAGRQRFVEQSGATGSARHSSVVVVLEGLVCPRPGCGQLVRQPPGRGRPRSWCSVACRKWGSRHEKGNFVTPAAPEIRKNPVTGGAP